jgi:NADH-quinone oxidoreductase subunit E
MSLQFSEETERAFQKILTRYPETHRRAALLPTLYLAQAEFGYVSVEAMEYVARRLALPPSKVLQVATFYTMYNKTPVGERHIQVCKSISCALMGGFSLLEYLEEKLKVHAGETTPDGRFTLWEVECLAGCGYAPMLQCNEDYHENLGAKAADGSWPAVDKLLAQWGLEGP